MRFPDGLDVTKGIWHGLMIVSMFWIAVIIMIIIWSMNGMKKITVFLLLLLLLISCTAPQPLLTTQTGMVIRGQEITGTGITVTTANCLIEDNYIHDVSGYGIYLSPTSSNCIVRNNKIARASSSGIWVSGQNNLIENNDISKTIQLAPHSNGGDANCITFFGSGHTFRGNYCHDIYTDGILVTDAHIDGFQTWDWTSVGGVGHDILFENNTMMFQRGGKIWQVEGGAYNLSMKNNVTFSDFAALIIDSEAIFIHNTFIGTGDVSDGLRLLRTDVTMYNNIFAHQRQRVIENLGGSSIVTASDNCYVDYGIMLPANPGDVRTTDAMFVDEAQLNYRLRPESPCVGMGVGFAEFDKIFLPMIWR
ncbi:MAG: right-handed parallel beta-helix repeat-containing protein [Candidatus Berkelbacteria bacterium]|nr:right-handed parallel beta-helix repeat-containing protein [Candidatus Berkelbacteria bacterium]